MQAYELSQLISQRDDSNKLYLEFLKVPDLSMGLYVLSAGGVLVSHTVGKTRPYVFNPRYPFLNELKNLLEKALSFYPVNEQEELVMNRRRPRAKGKDL